VVEPREGGALLLIEPRLRKLFDYRTAARASDRKADV